MEKTIQRTRDHSLDLIRTIAILCVIINHSVESTYPIGSISEMAAFSEAKQVFCYSCFVIGRVAVPLFLMLTGYLLLPREYDADKASVFYRKKFLSLLLVWEIWILIYQVFISWYDQNPVQPHLWLKRMLFLENAGLAHTWYMPTIIGIYLFIPLISVALKAMNSKTILLLMAVCYVYVFVIPLISTFLDASDFEKFHKELYLQFGGGMHGLYVIMGYMLARHKEQIKKRLSLRRIRVLTFLAALAAFTLAVITQIYLVNAGAKYNVWYDNPFLAVAALCLFILLMSTNIGTGAAGLAMQISRCSFGMFCVHMMVLMPLEGMVGESVHNYLKLLILFIVTSIASYAIVRVLGKIPKLKKLFLMK